MAPTSPASSVPKVMTSLSTTPGDRRGDRDRDERAREVHDRREQDRGARRDRLGGDRRRHRVGGVVEAVGEVEGQRGRDDQHQQEIGAHALRVPGSRGPGARSRPVHI
jgi:hypothetical protein